jgi:hypothetical protein
MDCIDNNICNCKRECKCNSGYECCSEDTKNSTFGMCVQIGCCDKKRGIPSKDCLDNKKCKNKVLSYPNDFENFEYHTREGFNDKFIIKNYILIIILIIMIFFYKKMLKSYK